MTILGLLVFGFVLGRATAPDAADEVVAAPPDTVVFPSGDVDRSGYWQFGGIEPEILDSFDRPDGDLDATDTGEPWQQVSGTWRVQDGEAAATPAQTSELSVVVVEAEAADGIVEATMTRAVPGAGVVFRYRNPQNHWRVTIADEDSLVVTRTVGGDSEAAGVVLAPTSDGFTISVNTNGDVLRFLVEGQERLRITDPVLAGETGAGLVLETEARAAARWDRFYVGGSGG